MTVHKLVLEKDIENAVVRHAKTTGWTPFKLNLQGNRGWPDRLFIYPGPLYVFIEFKQPGKKPTEIQYHRLGQLGKMGVVATWVDNIKEGTDLLDTAAATDLTGTDEES